MFPVGVVLIPVETKGCIYDAIEGWVGRVYIY